MPSIIQKLLRQQSKFETPQEELFLGLQIAADRAMAPWAAHLKQQANLTPVQYNVLRILRGAGKEGCLSGAIGERMISRAPDITRIVDRLEDRGLVRRKADAEDRRAVRVFLTAKGHALLEPLDGDAKALMRRHMKNVPHALVVSLRDQLNALLEAVAEQL